MNPEQHDILIRIDERVDQLLEGQKDQEKRIRGLEKFRAWVVGSFATLASYLGYKIPPIG